MGTRGGARPGAGRKKGSKSQATVAREKIRDEAIAEAKADGILPVDHMLKVLRSPETPEPRKDAMAIAAAPYIHPRLSSREVKVDATQRTIHELTIDELDALIIQHGGGVQQVQALTSGANGADSVHGGDLCEVSDR